MAVRVSLFTVSFVMYVMEKRRRVGRFRVMMTTMMMTIMMIVMIILK